MKTSRDLFARSLIESKSWEIDLKDLLSYNLSNYPLLLATAAGGLVKTTKSKMLEILESAVIDAKVDPNNVGDHNALIVDAMAALQAMKGKWKTFGEFADAVFASLIKLAGTMECYQTGLCCRQIYRDKH